MIEPGSGESFDEEIPEDVEGHGRTTAPDAEATDEDVEGHSKIGWKADEGMDTFDDGGRTA